MLTALLRAKPNLSHTPEMPTSKIETAEAREQQRPKNRSPAEEFSAGSWLMICRGYERQPPWVATSLTCVFCWTRPRTLKTPRA